MSGVASYNSVRSTLRSIVSATNSKIALSAVVHTKDRPVRWHADANSASNSRSTFNASTDRATPTSSQPERQHKIGTHDNPQIGPCAGLVGWGVGARGGYRGVVGWSVESGWGGRGFVVVPFGVVAVGLGGVVLGLRAAVSDETGWSG